MKWERVEPVEPCASPDGHEHRDTYGVGHYIPVVIQCMNCGARYGIRILEEDE